MKTQGRKLTARQQDFVALLPKCDWIAGEAVRQAGYHPKNNQKAYEMGSQLLKIPKVKEAVENMREQRLKKLGIHAERILQNRIRVAEADPRLFFNEDGTIKPPAEWTDEMAACVAGLEVVELFEGKGDEKRWVGYLKKIRFNDRNPAQHDLMDHAGLFPQKSVKVDVDVKEVQITNVGLSAKIFYLIHVALEKEKELEKQAAARPFPTRSSRGGAGEDVSGVRRRDWKMKADNQKKKREAGKERGKEGRAGKF